MRRFSALVAACLVVLLPVAAFAAWTGPTQSFPNGNVTAPLNVGTTNQVKNANLGVNGLAVFGNALFDGTNGDGNNDGINGYLNFGSTAGSSGYGIRDNAGVLEFKNLSGSWASLQSTVNSLVTESEVAIEPTVQCTGAYGGYQSVCNDVATGEYCVSYSNSWSCYVSPTFQNYQTGQPIPWPWPTGANVECNAGYGGYQSVCNNVTTGEYCVSYSGTWSCYVSPTVDNEQTGQPISWPWPN